MANPTSDRQPAATAKLERVDLDALRGAFQAAVPFNKTVGLELRELASDRCQVRLPDTERLRNHLGSQHAAALFAAGEAASGGAVAAAFVDRLGSVRMVVTDAAVRYLKRADGPITASAEVSQLVEQLQQQLEEDGTVAFVVDAELLDRSHSRVAQLTVRWQLKRTTP